MQTARARLERVDNDEVEQPRPRFRLVHSATAEEAASASSAAQLDDERAREAYIARLEASPERPELEPPARRPTEGRRTVRVEGRPKEPASARVATPEDFAPRTARARDRDRGLARGIAPVASAHLAARPDRIAMWAVMLGLFLAFMAIATGAQ